MGDGALVGGSEGSAPPLPRGFQLFDDLVALDREGPALLPDITRLSPVLPFVSASENKRRTESSMEEGGGDKLPPLRAAAACRFPERGMEKDSTAFRGAPEQGG
jgi:hypothetical protein